jgi:mRNA-degrading endonuclease YafQ of YafQ-DinJ toxin-antitoxin module
LELIATSYFLRRARKLREPQRSMLWATVRRFSTDPWDPLLRTHKLKGNLAGHWAFKVDDDLRVIVRWEGDLGYLVNVGSHDEVYR